MARARVRPPADSARAIVVVVDTGGECRRGQGRARGCEFPGTGKDLTVLLVSMHSGERPRIPTPVVRELSLGEARSSGCRERPVASNCTKDSRAGARFLRMGDRPSLGNRRREVASSRVGRFRERPPKSLEGSASPRYSLQHRKGLPGRDGNARVTRVTEDCPASPITKRTRT